MRKSWALPGPFLHPSFYVWIPAMLENSLTHKEEVCARVSVNLFSKTTKSLKQCGSTTLLESAHIPHLNITTS